MSGLCYGHFTPHNNASPDPVLLPDHGPCNPQTDGISHCCRIGHTCVSNGLCVTSSGFYYNGGCTDSTFQAAICPTFCTHGIANQPVECHGSAVKDGDFCCSFHRKSTTCCEVASNGLGLIAGISAALPVSARPDGASTVQTSVSTGAAPKLISSGATTSSSGSIMSSLSSSTPSRTDTFDSPVATPLPRGTTMGIAFLVPCTMLLLFGALHGIAWLIKRHKGQQPHSNGIPLNPMGNRREGIDGSDFEGQPTERDAAATEVEDSQFGTEDEGSPVVPVGPLDTGTSGNPVGPMNPPPSDIAAPDVAPDNEPLRTEVEGSQIGADVEGPPVDSVEMHASETPNEPTDSPPSYAAAPDVAPDNNPLREHQVAFGSWHDPNLGNL